MFADVDAAADIRLTYFVDADIDVRCSTELLNVYATAISLSQQYGK